VAGQPKDLQKMMERCPWATKDPLYKRYHDCEWGTPLHDDLALFELLILEGAQAGLSWITILRKRENYRNALDGFDPVKIAAYDSKKISELLGNSGIIRNRRKLEAAVRNAVAFLRIQDRFGGFDAYIWRFVDGSPVVNSWTCLADIPAQTLQSGAMSRAMKQDGFQFVGPTICYAFMQAAGLVNDHLTSCFRRAQLAGCAAPGN
jgi:DNA-3-methyladenine glycosylase I